MWFSGHFLGAGGREASRVPKASAKGTAWAGFVVQFSIIIRELLVGHFSRPSLSRKTALANSLSLAQYLTELGLAFFPWVLSSLFYNTWKYRIQIPSSSTICRTVRFALYLVSVSRFPWKNTTCLENTRCHLGLTVVEAYSLLLYC